DATDDEVRAAAATAHVTDFADEMPHGLDEVVGPGGSNLSGGQRQRVAFARAVLRDPEILILDEATSAVDALSEQLIHEALAEFAEGRTVFLVTHTVRKSLLDLVTRVAVMEQGVLAGVGPHNELLKNNAAYRSLYEAQTDDPGAIPASFGPDGSSDSPLEQARAAYRRSRPAGLHPGAISFDADSIDRLDEADAPPVDVGPQPDPVAYHYASHGQIFDPDEPKAEAESDEDDDDRHILPLRATGTDG
ncbi:MAG: ATP-binding cassette domain-containing protein, partial [Planctomycetota bacterium]